MTNQTFRICFFNPKTKTHNYWGHNKFSSPEANQILNVLSKTYNDQPLTKTILPEETIIINNNSFYYTDKELTDEQLLGEEQYKEMQKNLDFYNNIDDDSI